MSQTRTAAEYVEIRAEVEFVRRWNALMDERAAEEAAKWPLRSEDRYQ